MFLGMAEVSGLVYRIPGASWCLELPEEAVARLMAQAQRTWFSSELVGQLYSADPGAVCVRVDAVTKLPAKATNYTAVRLNLPAVDKERANLFAQGLHCLGFWHSHPEDVPHPSPEDIAMAADHARAGKTSFAGIVFVIVGRAQPPQGLGVWVHDGTTLWKTAPENSVEPPTT